MFRTLVLWIFSVLLLDSVFKTNGIEPSYGTSGTKTSDSDFVAGSAVKRTKCRVVLTIAAKNLPDKDIMSRSDPFCKVEGQDFGSSQWKLRGRTETLRNNLNPEFENTIQLDYYFERSQPLRFTFYDVDEKKVDFLGFATTKLEALVKEGYMELNLNTNEGELDLTPQDIAKRKQIAMKNKSSSLTSKAYKTLTGGSAEPSKILIWAEEYKNGQRSNGDDLVVMDVSAKNLLVGAKGRWFGLTKPNPYIVISKQMNNAKKSFKLVHKSEVVTSTRKPQWPQVLAMYSVLAEGDPNRKLKFECKDSQARSHHASIGEFVTTIAEIQQSKDGEFLLIDEKREKSSKYKNSGKMKIRNLEIIKTASFLEYVQGDLDINAIIAIDFTLSNGWPDNPRSLHHMNRNPLILNPYEQAISAVVSIIQAYDSDKQLPTFGYGAKLPPKKNKTYHIFPVDLETQKPECYKVEGVLEKYRECVPKIEFSQPTHFAEVIRYAVDAAREYKNGENYAILLIITDGEIHDMDETKKAIIDGSDLPLSIIIVGVGSGDFESMEKLDSDDGLLQYKDRTAKRDIVQFVEFKKYSGPEQGKLLADEVLAEVPKQLITYMATHRLKPRHKPKPAKPVRSTVSESRSPPPQVTDENPPNPYASKGHDFTSA